jgi:hypothetical protein
MVRINLTEENLISTTGVADRRFADHSGDIQQGYELGSLTRGLVAYYSMEKGQGQVLHDGALDNLGQIEGATWNGSGQVGSDALSFNGSSNYVNIGKAGTYSAMTISVWLKWSASGSFQSAFGYADTGNSESVGIFVDNQNDGGFSIAFDDGTNRNAVNTPSGGYGDGNWHHIVGTLSKSGTNTIYADGTKINSASDGDPDLGTISQSLDYYIGAINLDDSPSDYFAGEIDDFRIYDRALSQPEIEALAGLTEPSGFLVEEQDVPTLREFERDLGGAVSRYEFENDVTDSWGDNDGTDNTSAGFVDGVYGQAKDFDGNDDFISTQYSQSGVSDFTLSLWLNKSGSTGVLVSDGNSAPADRTSFIVSGDVVDIIVEDDSGNISKLSSQTFDDGEWIHSVATFKANDNTRLYINGQLENSENHSVGPPDNPNNNVAFGHDPEDGDTHYNGAIDDVRIYERALDPAEVEQLYNKGAYRIKRGEL